MRKVTNFSKTVVETTGKSFTIFRLLADQAAGKLSSNRTSVYPKD